MKDAPSGFTAEQLLALARGFMQSRLIITGAELDLYSLLAPAPLTAQEVAQRLGGPLRSVAMLLDALSALGLLEKGDESYRTAPAMIPLL